MCLLIIEAVWEFFFFQAEDGIRDIGVTGVQTCALPISTKETPAKGHNLFEHEEGREAFPSPFTATVLQPGRSGITARLRAPLRSEESRVGKECRSRWSPYH